MEVAENIKSISIQDIFDLYNRKTELKTITEHLHRDESCKINAQSVAGSSASFIAAVIFQAHPSVHLHILSDKEEAAYFYNNLENIFRKIEHNNTAIAYSPNWIGSSMISFTPFKGFETALISKYVGKQYLDNTQNDTRKLDAFFVNDLRINYSFKTKYIRSIGITLAINNLFSEQYESNGYTWGYIYGGQRVVENFYYAQAGVNYMAGLSFKF